MAALAATVPSGLAAAAEVPPGRPDLGVSAYPFELGQVRLTAGRWLDNQNRTLAYLRFVDVGRLRYNFHFEFRSHSQGHFLTAWAQAGAVLGDTVCRDKANLMVAELAKCQAVETGVRKGVPYYCLHTGNGSRVVAWADTGTTDHLWRFI